MSWNLFGIAPCRHLNKSPLLDFRVSPRYDWSAMDEKGAAGRRICYRQLAIPRLAGSVTAAQATLAATARGQRTEGLGTSSPLRGGEVRWAPLGDGSPWKELGGAGHG
jgi:hypothetical protein